MSEAFISLSILILALSACGGVDMDRDEYPIHKADLDLLNGSCTHNGGFKSALWAIPIRTLDKEWRITCEDGAVFTVKMGKGEKQ